VASARSIMYMFYQLLIRGNVSTVKVKLFRLKYHR
jgi:hypothetical protein